jgi:serine/threonine protein kinase
MLNELFIQKVIRHIVSGLEYMHIKNIIHRDINLKNILINFNKYQNFIFERKIPAKINYSNISLNDSFNIKITDLDYSKNIEDSNINVFIVGSSDNTSPYMFRSVIASDPENFYNNKLNLWYLGIITYELLTGEESFSGNDTQDIYNKIREGNYKLSTTLISLGEIISFINGLMQFNPEKRCIRNKLKFFLL